MFDEDNQSLVALLKRLWVHITTRRRKQFAILFLLMIVCSIAEVISIGAILPFLAVLTAPERLFDISLVRVVATKFEITSPQELLMPITIFFCVAALVSGG